MTPPLTGQQLDLVEPSDISPSLVRELVARGATGRIIDVPDPAAPSPCAAGEAPYQVLSPLRPVEYAALRADVAKRGVLVAVEVDEAGRVLDGHHRVAIAGELGINYPVTVRAGLSEDAKREHALRMNLLRRHLGPISWAGGFRSLCQIRGVALGQGARNDRTSASVAEVAQELGVPERTMRHRLQIADELAEHSEIAEAVDRGDLSVHEARSRLNADYRAALKAKPVSPPAGTYSTLVLDPPWETGELSRHVRPQQVGFTYPSMSPAELRDFKSVIDSVAAPDCQLCLWTTQRQLPFALELVAHWGFNYQCLLTWVKNVGMTPYSFMYTTEHVVYAHRGRPRLLKLGRPLHFEAKTTGHSVKPDAFFDLLRKVAPEPRLELFARRPHDGFEAWGNEVEAGRPEDAA